METGAPAMPHPSVADPPAPRLRRKGKAILAIFILLVLILLAGLLLGFPKPAPTQFGSIKIRSLNPGTGNFLQTPLSRMPRVLLVENHGANPVVIWEPCRIERKETGSIVVAGSQNHTFLLQGTNAFAGMATVTVQLTGSNHGPWRVLLPVSHYGLFARFEKFMRMPFASLMARSRTVNRLLLGSKTWVASDWFDDDQKFVTRFEGGMISPHHHTRNNLSGSDEDHPSPPLQPWAGEASGFHRSGFGPVERQIILDAQDDSQTFFFIILCFYSHHHHWPANFAEVESFAAEKVNLQPPVPSTYENAAYTNAVFATNSDGGLKIVFSNGSMSIGKPP